MNSIKTSHTIYPFFKTLKTIWNAKDEIITWQWYIFILISSPPLLLLSLIDYILMLPILVFIHVINDRVIYMGEWDDSLWKRIGNALKLWSVIFFFITFCIPSCVYALTSIILTIRKERKNRGKVGYVNLQDDPCESPNNSPNFHCGGGSLMGFLPQDNFYFRITDDKTYNLRIPNHKAREEHELIIGRIKKHNL